MSMVLDEKKMTDDPLDKIALKEKGKNASRERREKENAEFSELARLLPVPYNLDKASLVRLTISYIKMKEALFEGHRFPSLLDGELPFDFMESLDGFLMILEADGKISYISETVTQYLGQNKLLMMGSSIYDYVHADDCDELRSTLSQPLSMNGEYGMEKYLCLWMKCLLGKRSAGLTNGSFKAVHFNGYLKMNVRGQPTLMAMGKCLPSSPTTKVELTANMFMFRAGCDFKLSYLDDSVSCIGYRPDDLIDKSLYDYVHIYDIHPLRYSHRQLLRKGQSISKYYRFLCRTGGYTWIQSHMSVVNGRSGRPPCIVSLNHVISDIEQGDLILSQSQRANARKDDDPRQEFENSLLPTTILIEDSSSEVSSNDFSYSSEVHTALQFVYEPQLFAENAAINYIL